MNSIVIVNNVSFEFPNGHEVFSNLNFSLDNRLTALVGPNGIGKTTLALLLAKVLQPTSGVIYRNGSITFFPQREEPPCASVNEVLGFNYAWSLTSEKLLQGINRLACCTTLSGGQWMRVRLASTLNDQFLVLDEPTNNLDREGRNAVMQFLCERKGGVLLISHDRECLHLCDEILELSNRGLSKYSEGWASYCDERDRERKNLKSALALATRDREATYTDRIEKKNQQEKRNRHGAKTAARGGQPKILLGARKRRAQTTTAKIDTMTLQKANDTVRKAYQALREIKVDPVMYIDFADCKIPAQKLIAEAIHFNIRFHNWIYHQDLNFVWRGPLRIAFKGENGSGKSTLIKALLGKEFQVRGSFRRGVLNVLYVDQNCAQLDDNKSVFENIRDSSNLSESEIRNGLAQFLFAKEFVFQKVAALSGGERLRAILAKGFISSKKPELLILDEPTNNLDLANIQFLENLISQYQGALIIISHDEVFLKNCRIDQVKNFNPQL